MHAAAYRYHQSKHPPFTKDEEVAAAREIRRLRDAAWEAVLRSQSPDDLVAAFTFPEREEGEGHVGREIERATSAAFAEVQASGEWSTWAACRTSKPGDLFRNLLPDVSHDLAPLVSACDLDLLALARATDKRTPEWHAIIGAVRRFEERNVGLVFHLSRKFWRSNVGFTVDDLVGFAFEGLRVGVLRFDPDKGFRFSTYASGWIRHKVGRAIDDYSRHIRLPVHVIELAHKVAKHRAQVQAQGLPWPSEEEVAVALGVKPDKVRRAVRLCTSQPASMEAPSLYLSNEPGAERATLGSILPDDSITPADDEIALTEREALVREAIQTLTDKQRLVLDERVMADEPAKLKELGAVLGVSRERVRQIESESLGEVRNYLAKADRLADGRCVQWRQAQREAAHA